METTTSIDRLSTLRRLSSIQLPQTGEFGTRSTHAIESDSTNQVKGDGFITRQLSVNKQTWENLGERLQGLEPVSVSFLDIATLEVPVISNTLSGIENGDPQF